MFYRWVLSLKVLSNHFLLPNRYQYHYQYRMWFSVACTLIDNEYASSQWSKCCGITRLRLLSPQEILTTVVTCIIVYKSTDQAKPHFDFFFSTITTNKENDVFRAPAWTIDRSSVVSLIDNGKLANQIARSAAIVKIVIFYSSLLFYNISVFVPAVRINVGFVYLLWPRF